MPNSIPGLEDTPFLTESVGPVTGRLKARVEDFRVDEVPLYDAGGEGEHLFLRIEKQGISTHEALNRLGRALGVSPASMGVAGQKDAHAVSTQFVSVSGIDEARLEGVTLPGIDIISVARHSNKLRVGHLRGNEFKVRLAGAGPSSLEKARECMNLLVKRGVPNGYMGQRFGRRKNTHLLGRALVRGDTREFLNQLLSFGAEDGEWAGAAAEAVARRDFGAARKMVPHYMVGTRRALGALEEGREEGRAVRAVPKRDLQLYLSAYQSFLFNKALARRLPRVDEIEKGDLAFIHGKGAVFSVEDPEAEAPRARAFEISPSGPIFGHKMRAPTGRCGEVERGILEAEGLSAPAFRLGGGLSQKGARRPLRFPLEGVEVEEEGEDLIFRFFLPKGSYATAVFWELGKGAIA
ncbi:MAG: tRNA pseudouridine(13) synthase TruD [Planctomycetota bacterium]|jgi:tRNA pseudouridine13 synthase